MNFSVSPITRACTLALGLTLLHGCDSDGEYNDVENVSQSTGGSQEFVDLSSQGQQDTTEDNSPTVNPGGGVSTGDGSDDSGDGSDTDDGDGSGDDGDDTGGDDDSDTDGDGSGGDDTDGDDGSDTGGDDSDGDDGSDTGGDDTDGDDGSDTGGDDTDGDDGSDTGGDDSDGDDGSDTGGDDTDGDDGSDTGGDDSDGDDGSDTGGDDSDGDDGSDNGGGDTDGESNCGSNCLGAPSRDLAISALEYAATHSNLARFAETLATDYTAAGTYQCVNGGTASFSGQNRSYNHDVPTWAFDDCQLPADNSVNITYNGHLSTVCAASNRTSTEATLECSVTYNNLQVSSVLDAAAINGSAFLTIENASMRSDSSDLSTATAMDTWSTPAQTIASESGELRGVNIRVDTLADSLALTFSGQGDFRLSEAGCLISGELLLADYYSDAEISIAGQNGSNMLLDTGDSTETIACSEIQALPYTAAQFR